MVEASSLALAFMIGATIGFQLYDLCDLVASKTQRQSAESLERLRKAQFEEAQKEHDRHWRDF